MRKREKRTVHSNLSVVLEVALVGDNDDWERVLVLDTQNLLVECADFLERIARRDGVDQEEALARAHVLLAHSTGGEMVRTRGRRDAYMDIPIFFLTRSVQDVEESDLVVNDALLPV